MRVYGLVGHVLASLMICGNNCKVPLNFNELGEMNAIEMDYYYQYNILAVPNNPHLLDHVLLFHQASEPSTNFSVTNKYPHLISLCLSG